MRSDIEELKVNVEKFFLLLQNYPDDSGSTLVFGRFLRAFLRTNTCKEVLPTIEVMTLIKEHKPTIFHTMKKLSEKDSMLAILTGLSMDSSEAENRLQSIYESKEVGR
jgi:hypothetical protein